MLGLWQNPAICGLVGTKLLGKVRNCHQRRLFAARTRPLDSFSFRGIAKRSDSADPLKVAVEIEVGRTRDLSWFISGATVCLYGVHCYLRSHPLTWMPRRLRSLLWLFPVVAP
jgi:hypothetical protein